MIKVVNKHTHKKTPNDVYIGRGRGSVLGNPYSHKDNTLAIYKTSSREESIAKYKIWLYKQIASDSSPQMEAIRNILTMARKGDVNLVCYCSPQSCHGDVIKELLEDNL